LNELSLDDNTINQLNTIFIKNGDTSSDELLEEEGLHINEIETSSDFDYEDASPEKSVPEINMLTK